MLDKPIQPVADGFLNNAVTLSEGIDLSALLAADRRENAFSRLLTLRLLTHLVEFFQSDIVEPTHYTELLSRSVKVFSRPYQPVNCDIESLREALVEYHDLLPWLLRLSIGLPLVGAGFSGYFFSPVFRPAASTFVRLFGITVGFLLLFGLATRAVAALGLSAYLIGLVSNPSLLLAFEYLPGFIAIVLLGGGRPSADHVIAKMAADERTSYSRIDPFYRAVALPFESWVKPYVQFVPTVTRVGLGLAFIYLGLTQKLLSPGTALAVVAKYHLTEVVPVAPELWVLGAGLVEMLVGVMLIAGAFTRLFSGVAILLFTTTLFGLPDDPVLAHISLFGLVSALIITGAGPFAFDTIRHGAESEAPPSIVGE